MNFKEKIQRIKADIPAVFLSLRDDETPLIAKIMAVVTVGYALSPVDLIPDFIPVFGYLDDFVLLPMLVLITVKLIPEEVWIRNSIKSQELWKDGKPKKWYYAIPVILIWLLIIWLIMKWIFI